MKFKKANVVYFSPASTFKQVAESIVHGTGIKDVFVTNLTCKSSGEVIVPSDSLAIVVVPVYRGKVAPLAMERLETIRGKNTSVVLA